MDIIKQEVPASSLAGIVNIPSEYKDMIMEVTVRPSKKELAKKLRGIVSLDMTRDEIRNERLGICE